MAEAALAQHNPTVADKALHVARQIPQGDERGDRETRALEMLSTLVSSRAALGSLDPKSRQAGFSALIDRIGADMPAIVRRVFSFLLFCRLFFSRDLQDTRLLVTRARLVETAAESLFHAPASARDLLNLAQTNKPFLKAIGAKSAADIGPRLADAGRLACAL